MEGTANPGSNADERRRWNHGGWVSAWPKREELTAAVSEVLLDHLRLDAGDRVLDVGSGGGKTSLAAGRLVGEHGHVVGADFSEPLVGLAQQRAQSERASNVQFVVADVQHDVIQGAPFSVAMSQFGVMFFDEPRRAFANILDQVESGGRLGFACWQPLLRNPWHIRNAIDSYVPTAPLPSPGKSRPGPFSLADAAYTAELLRSAGWSDVHCAAYNMTIEVARETLVHDGQLTDMGVPNQMMAEAEAVVERHLAQFDRGDGRYQVTIAPQIFTARKRGQNR